MSPEATSYRLPHQDAPILRLRLKTEPISYRYFCREGLVVGGGLVSKEASPTCPSTYQGFWYTSGAMVVSPEATPYLLPRQDAPILGAEA